MWIKYTMPGEEIPSMVPVQVANGSWVFCDGAYDVFDYFYQDGREDSPEYDEFESKVLSACDRIAAGESVCIDVQGLNLELMVSDD